MLMNVARRIAVLLFLLTGALTPPVAAQDAGIDVDFLLNYYDQDGEHSPVTGGIGDEDLQVVAPVVVVRWAMSDTWTLSADLGVDNITSASTDRIDTEVSSASRQDNRAYTVVTASRQRENQTWRFGLGFSNEYDYQSLNGRLGWSIDLNERNTTLGVSLAHFADTVELYDIDGVVRGEDDRATTDLGLSLTQVLGRGTVLSATFSYSQQSGFLSTPFHEVILAPSPEDPEGRHVAERLPDSRDRLAAGLSLNQAWGERFVLRLAYRFYDDDFGIQAHTVEVEPHFRLPLARQAWIFPILRFHTQTASDYFGLPGAFRGDEPYFTADRDLSAFDSEKYGLGLQLLFDRQRSGWLRRLRAFEVRLTTYSRDDGLEALSISFAWRWSF